jgi:hypothetical protein
MPPLLSVWRGTPRASNSGPSSERRRIRIEQEEEQAMTLYTWSKTASNNATADATINWAEG